MNSEKYQNNQLLNKWKQLDKDGRIFFQTTYFLVILTQFKSYL